VGISQMHVSRLLAASLERLRKSVLETTAAGAPAGAPAAGAVADRPAGAR